MAYTTLVAGTTITASWANGSVRDQSVSPFASAAARTSAITAPIEGMVSHLNDVNTLAVYSGAAWSTIGPVHGAPTSWTPVVIQSATPTLTVTSALYTRTGRWVQCNFLVAITSAGTAANDVSVSLPVTAAAGSVGYGIGGVIDASATQDFWSIATLVSTTAMKFRSSSTTTATYLGTTTFTAALASGDSVYGSMAYIAAADA